MYIFQPQWHNEGKVEIMKAECRRKEERERLSRRVWCPAKPISALLNTSCAKRGAVRRETPLTATGTVALPNHSAASHQSIQSCLSGVVPGLAGRRRSSVNRIEEKIKKGQKSLNPCDADLKPSVSFLLSKSLLFLSVLFVPPPPKKLSDCRSLSQSVAVIKTAVIVLSESGMCANTVK
jgi:hypothetical protein